MFFISVLVFPSIKLFEPLLLDVDQQPHIHKKQKAWDQFRVLYILYIIYIKVLYIIWKPCLWRYRKFGHISGSIFSQISTYYRKYSNSCNDLTYFDWVTVTTKMQFLLAKELITILEKKSHSLSRTAGTSFQWGELPSYYSKRTFWHILSFRT